MTDKIDPDVRALAESELEECRRHFFEFGDPTKLVTGVQWCVTGQLPLPHWLAPEVAAAMVHFFRKGGANGRGKGGGLAVRYQRQRTDRLRHQIAEHELARRTSVGGNMQDAFERTSERLRGTLAQGSADAIKKSYFRIQRALKKLKAA